jgi:hypothetical protein
MSTRFQKDWVSAHARGVDALVEPKKGQMLLAAAIGIAVAWTPIFAPIHEAGHFIIGILDPDVSIMKVGWRITWFVGDPNVLFFVGGHIASTIATGSIATFLALKRGAVAPAMFFVGHTLTQPFYAYQSRDFSQLELAFGRGEFRLWIVVTSVITIVCALYGFAAAMYVREVRKERLRRGKAA